MHQPLRTLAHIDGVTLMRYPANWQRVASSLLRMGEFPPRGFVTYRSKLIPPGRARKFVRVTIQYRRRVYDGLVFIERHFRSGD